jgi:hypothetical protein
VQGGPVEVLGARVQVCTAFQQRLHHGCEPHSCRCVQGGPSVLPKGWPSEKRSGEEEW